MKKCQIVQTNWKVSPQWQLQNEAALDRLEKETDAFFTDKYGYRIFKQNASLSQILLQGECDTVGISIQSGRNQVYAVDVAFHEAGLNYGTREKTVMKIVAKTVRTAMCLYGYMGCRDAELIFTSPKINSATLGDITPCIKDLNHLFRQEGYDFRARIIANEEFNTLVLQPTQRSCSCGHIKCLRCSRTLLLRQTLRQNGRHTHRDGHQLARKAPGIAPTRN